MHMHLQRAVILGIFHAVEIELLRWITHLSVTQYQWLNCPISLQLTRSCCASVSLTIFCFMVGVLY